MYKEELFIDGKLNSELLKREKWLYYLVVTENDSVNRERIEVIGDITGKESLNYVFRTLDILESLNLPKRQHEIIKKVLQWSEVSKGGTEAQRKKWIEKGYPLDIHNIASAEIYMEHANKSDDMSDIVYTFIQTHGIIGQNIRGEAAVRENMPIYELCKNYSMQEKEEIKNMLMALNVCVVGAADINVWNNIKTEAYSIISKVCDGIFDEYDSIERMTRLSGKLKDASQDTISFFENNIFNNYQLWYFDSALGAFGEKQIVQILRMATNDNNDANVQHINLKALSDSLYYDYEGKKHINVYKLRIIEKYLKDNSIENVKLNTQIINSTLSIDFTFSRVCEKLIDFCVEAERSGLLSFEKSINVLYEMFGFKRDEFDRLNNEDKYLDTMNDAASTKLAIADFAVGDTVVDVGSGGGVMLDLLESKYPEKQIIGTDISTNVLNVLKEKRDRENHKWDAIKHNFVDGPLKDKVDSIIFSSILHEIYSYTETENGRFDISSVKNALKNAYDSLKPGGRIIIRDGVKTDSNVILEIEFKEKNGLEFFNNYERDFQGLPGTDRRISKDGLKVSGDINFIREFMYTYTWGNESYSHEIHEQFGYFTLNEFRAFFETLGADVIESREFLEDGYYDNLSQYIVLDKKDYPLSNCIVVVEKR